MSRDFARHLRNEMTDAERHLWKSIRHPQLGGWKFRRQSSIGAYTVDFVCFEKKLIIELDGGQHDARREYDAERTARLESQGFRVMRFWNHQVFEERDDILEPVWVALGATPHPNPPPQGGRGPEEEGRRPEKKGPPSSPENATDA
ncbi:MAG: endonuclease domain-containing protein [Gemmataceae bacterium]